MRLTTDLFAYCKENIPKWNTVSISGYHFREKGVFGRPGGRVHARVRHGLRAGGARCGPEGRRLRAAAGVLLQRPQQRLSGGREVPCGPEHVGARDEGALRRRRSAQPDAALPHADRRRHAHGPAADEQHRPRRAAGLRRGLRRHAVPAHQRLRRGARAPVRTRREARPQNPAGDRLRVRRDRHGRPVRRLLLRGVAHGRDREARVGADREDRRPGRLGRGDLVHQERDRGIRVRLPRALPAQPGRRGRRQRVRRGLRRGRGDPLRRPGIRARSAHTPEGLQARTATRRAPTSASKSSSTPPKARTTCCRRSARRSRTTPPSARSAARCARSSASTSPRSDGAGRRRVGTVRRPMRQKAPETFAERLAQLEELRAAIGDHARRHGRREAAREGQVHGPRADREAARPRLLPGARHVCPPSDNRLRHAEEPALRRRGRDRPRHDRRAPRLRVQPGLHGLRRLAGRGHGREDVQDHGSGGQDRLPRDRDQRLRRRAHPGGRRLARRLRRRLPAQRPLLGRDPADLADHGPVRGRRGLLPRDHGLRVHGQGDLAHVHHRPRGDQDGHRRGGRLRGPRRRDEPRHQVRRRALRGRRRGRLPRGRPLPVQLPAAEQPRDRSPRPAERRPGPDGRGARLDRPRRRQQALRHPRRRALRGRRRRVPRGPRALRAEHRRRVLAA